MLAGAAHAAEVSDTSDDGLLTAEEARSLSLFGTQLVVLSACDTGRGTVKAGQGVYGLRERIFCCGSPDRGHEPVAGFRHRYARPHAALLSVSLSTKTIHAGESASWKQ